MVLLDVTMPGVSGDAIIAPISQTAAVIVVTARLDPDLAPRLVRRGAVDVVPKPVELRRLGDAVVAALARRAAQRGDQVS